MFWDAIIDAVVREVGQKSDNTDWEDAAIRPFVDQTYYELCYNEWAAFAVVEYQETNANVDLTSLFSTATDPFADADAAADSRVLALVGPIGHSTDGSALYTDVHLVRDQNQFSFYDANGNYDTSIALIYGHTIAIPDLAANDPYLRLPLALLGPVRASGEEDDTGPAFHSALTELGEQTLIVETAAKAAAVFDSDRAGPLREKADRMRQELRKAAIAVHGNADYEPLVRLG